MAAIGAANIVFLDPDNGIAGKCSKYSKKAPKYAFPDELRRLNAFGKTVVVYQHQHRRGTLADQVNSIFMQFGVATAFAVSFHAFTVRIYYVFPASESDGQLLRQRATQFVAGGWKKWVRLHGISQYSVASAY